MGQLKDSSGRNILGTICNFIKKEDENFENIKRDFPCLLEACKLSFIEISPSFNKLKKELALQGNILKKLVLKKDTFYDKAEKLFNIYSKEVEKLENLISCNFKIFEETAKYFGYEQKDTKFKNPEEFFNLFNDFLNLVEKNMPLTKQEPKKNYNRKFEVGKKIVGNAKQMEDVIKQMKTRENN